MLFSQSETIPSRHCLAKCGLYVNWRDTLEFSQQFWLGKTEVRVRISNFLHTAVLTEFRQAGRITEDFCPPNSGTYQGKVPYILWLGSWHLPRTSKFNLYQNCGHIFYVLAKLDSLAIMLVLSFFSFLNELWHFCLTVTKSSETSVIYWQLRLDQMIEDSCPLTCLLTSWLLGQGLKTCLTLQGDLKME